jgi:hypothetical protein
VKPAPKSLPFTQEGEAKDGGKFSPYNIRSARPRVGRVNVEPEKRGRDEMALN